jgi:hypothetical protein
MIEKLAPLFGAAKAAALAAMAVALFGAGWHVNGWRLNGGIERLKAERANDRATQAEAALADMAAATKMIRDKAAQLAAAETALGGKLDTLTKEFKHEREINPLPADCKPDAMRLRQLRAAVDAANQAAAGR